MKIGNLIGRHVAATPPSPNIPRASMSTRPRRHLPAGLFHQAMAKLIGIILGLGFIGTAQAQTASPTEQVLQTGIFGEGLVWTGSRAPGDGESLDLLNVLSHVGETGGTTNLDQFFTGHPQSPWAASLHHDYALYCRQLGRTSEALKQWQTAWDLVKDDDSPAARKLAGSIVANWMNLLSSLGRLDKLKELIAVGNNLQFASPHNRDLFQSARNAYYLMKAHPGIAYRCGTFALKAVGEKLGIGQNLEALVGLRSPTNGFSMEQLVEIGKQHGLDLVAVHRPLQVATNEQDLIVPSVVHWRANHYAAILEKRGDYYLVSDPTFGSQRYLTAAVINEETSGDFLIPAALQTQGWTPIETNEIASIHGMGLQNNINDGYDKGIVPTKPPCGMPVWWVTEPYINLWMADEPISYLTSRGDPMTLRLSYKQRDTRPSPYSSNWNNSWFSFVIVQQQSPTTPCGGTCMPVLSDSTVTVYLPNGGEVDFAPFQTYDPETRISLQQQDQMNSGLDYVVNGVRLVYADGSQDIYGDGMPYNSGSLYFPAARLFRTRHIDPHGNTTTYYYTGNVRYVIDSDGRTNTLVYNSNELLSSVTNAYGQTVQLKYDANNNLTNIVDAQGLSSSFTWDTNNNPTALITPYGTTQISVVNNGITYGGGGFGNAGGDDAPLLIDRSALIVDPTGATNLYMYRYDAENPEAAATFSNVPTNTPLGTLDTGNADTNTDNGLNAVYFRNSYHWGPRQFAALSTANMTNFTANDYLLARMQHWLQDTNDQYITEYCSVERDPSPDGVTEGLKTFYDYQGKTLTYRQGTNPLPSVIAWCLPGGETHSEYKIFDFFGNVTNDITTYTLPNGGIGTRTNQFIYTTNTYVYQYGLLQSGSFNQEATGTYVVPNLLTKIIGADGNPIWSFGGFDTVVWTNYYYHGTAGSTTAAIETSSRVLPDFATNGLGQVASYSYSGGTPVVLNDIIDANQFGLTYGGYDKLTGMNSVAGLTTTNLYNAKGFLAQIIDFQIGRTNSFSYGMDGLPTAFTNELGLNIALSWDNLLRLTGTVFPDGTYTSNRYDRLDLGGERDRLGNWTSYAHDGARHLTVITNANNAVTMLSWCGCGSLVGIVDALTNLTQFNYDLQGNMTNLVFPDYSTLNYQYDLAGRPTNIFDGAGRFLQLAYNNQNLVVAGSNANGQVFSRLFDIKDRPASITDANKVTVTNTFDPLDEILARTWPDGLGEGYGYAPQGMASFTNRDNYVTLYGRNAAGWLMAVTNANGEVNQVTRDPAGDVLTLLDGLNHQTTWQFNQYGWLTNKIDALERNSLQLAYAPNGWLTNRWTPEKGNTAFVRDYVGNVTRVVYPQLTISNAYDAVNELTNMVDAAGSHNFTWTPAHRLQSESDAWTTVSNAYSQGLRTLLTIVQSGTNWTQSYAYDAGWRLTNTASLAGGFIYQYQSALMNTPSSILLPNGAYITNTFNSLANLKSTALANHWGHVLDGYTYAVDPLGLRTNIARNFGLTTNLANAGYDQINQLKSWTATESTGTPRWNEQFGWAYDAADNLVKRTNNLLVQNYTADVANELTGITRTGNYTLAGAIPAPASSASGVLVNGQAAQVYGDFTFARTNLTLQDGSNTFSSVGVNVYSVRATNLYTVNWPQNPVLVFDNNGNLTNDGVHSYAFDAENQMTNVIVAGAWRSDFVYDGLHRRRIERDYTWGGSVWTKTNEVRFVYDGYLLVQERDTNNTVLTTYTRGLDRSGRFSRAGGIGGLLARTDTNGTMFYHADGNGNVTALIDGYENIAGRYLYSPFGKLLGQWGRMAAANVMRFSSKPQIRDGYDYGRRWYSPELGRWLNRDPLGEAGGLNLFAFGQNDPVNLIDTWGEICDTLPFIPAIDPYDLNHYFKTPPPSGPPYQNFGDPLDPAGIEPFLNPPTFDIPPLPGWDTPPWPMPYLNDGGIGEDPIPYMLVQLIPAAFDALDAGLGALGKALAPKAEALPKGVIQTGPNTYELEIDVPEPTPSFPPGRGPGIGPGPGRGPIGPPPPGGPLGPYSNN